MEPREAAMLPVPDPADLAAAWTRLRSSSATFDGWLADGRWSDVVSRVDDVLLREVMGLEADHVEQLREALDALRSRRLSRSEGAPRGQG
jgi:hypothetical protein